MRLRSNPNETWPGRGSAGRHAPPASQVYLEVVSSDCAGLGFIMIFNNDWQVKLGFRMVRNFILCNTKLDFESGSEPEISSLKGRHFDNS